MFHLSKRTRLLIRKALREDIGRGDVTTRAIIPFHLMGGARIVAKASGMMCGGPVVAEVFRAVDSRLKIAQRVHDGSRIAKGGEVFVIQGRIASILKAERVALNFLGRLSGIATLTRRYVEQTKGTRARIFDTRKTTPLWREIEKYAVRCGGGHNHRQGLFDEVLIKDNHWKAIWHLLDESRCRYFGAKMGPLIRRARIPVEVEVDNVRSLEHLLEGPLFPDRILLDHFTISQLRKAVSIARKCPRQIELEASGNISPANVRAIAKTGVQRISVGAITHSAPVLDVSLQIRWVDRRAKRRKA